MHLEGIPNASHHTSTPAQFPRLSLPQEAVCESQDKCGGRRWMDTGEGGRHPRCGPATRSVALAGPGARHLLWRRAPAVPGIPLTWLPRVGRARRGAEQPGD